MCWAELSHAATKATSCCGHPGGDTPVVVASWEPQGPGFGGSGHPGAPSTATLSNVLGCQGGGTGVVVPILILSCHRTRPHGADAAGPRHLRQQGSGNSLGVGLGIDSRLLLHPFLHPPTGFSWFFSPLSLSGLFPGEASMPRGGQGKLEHGSPRCGQAGCSGFAQGLLRGCSGDAQALLQES